MRLMLSMTAFLAVTCAGVRTCAAEVWVDPAGQGLREFTSLGEWNSAGDAESWTVSGARGVSVAGGVLAGADDAAGAIDPQVLRTALADGPDLDLGYRDCLEIRLQVAAGYEGAIEVYWGTTTSPGFSGSRVVRIPAERVPADGAFHIYRIDMGLAPAWRDFLRDLRIDPLDGAGGAGRAFALDYVRVGDLGPDYLPNYLYYPEGAADVNDAMSKHFRVVWGPSDETSMSWGNFTTKGAEIARGNLRNMEDQWQVYAGYEFSREQPALLEDFFGVTHGILRGAHAWVALDGEHQGMLALDGSSAYAILPRSVSDVDDITIGAWLKWGGGAANQRVFEFGGAADARMYLTPNDGTGRCALVLAKDGVTETLVAPALPAGVWTHVAVALGGDTGTLYVNGRLVAAGTITIDPEDLNAPDTNATPQANYLGRGVDGAVPSRRSERRRCGEHCRCDRGAGLPVRQGRAALLPRERRCERRRTNRPLGPDLDAALALRARSGTGRAGARGLAVRPGFRPAGLGARARLRGVRAVRGSRAEALREGLRAHGERRDPAGRAVRREDDPLEADCPDAREQPRVPAAARAGRVGEYARPVSCRGRVPEVQRLLHEFQSRSKAPRAAWYALAGAGVAEQMRCVMNRNARTLPVSRNAVVRPASRVVVCAAAVLASLGVAQAADARFRRGDVNADARVDIGDAIATLGYLFGRSFQPACLDAADANDSGAVDIADAIFTLGYLFAHGAPPPAPGPLACGRDDVTPDMLACVAQGSCDQGPVQETVLAGHVLNRLAYGPSPADVAHTADIGVTAYIDEQLNPGSIDESANTALSSREAPLFTERVPTRDTAIVPAGRFWRYLKGTAAPPAGWNDRGFDASAWSLGPAGIGYGDNDDATVLADMQGGYTSVYLRREFRVTDTGAFARLVLRVDYDDGFVAYVNGAEVARSNVNGSPPAHTATAGTNHEAGSPEEFAIANWAALLVPGDNVLAIQVHNQAIGSGDLSMSPELIGREDLPGPPIREIAGIDALQALIHVRGVYSRRQLQSVLAEFWDNHLTTDFDKVADYLDALQNSDASDAMPRARALAEAAALEHREYEFFREHALESFGELLLFSATSPAQLIYLDNVLNVKAAPNENYAREIFELFAFGVDNRYTQTDIEQLARCFTGWSICKVPREAAPAFPASARNPPLTCGVELSDAVILDLGPGWKYFKGAAEPSPEAGTGAPTLAWTAPEFDDAAWLDGATGIGYGDNDDATVLTDMQGAYVAVYARRRFDRADLGDFVHLVLAIDYDDGFIAYLNGYEVGRSASMRNAGAAPAYTAVAGDSREAGQPEYFNLDRFTDILRPTGNLLAVQVRNASLTSGDLSCRPRLLDRTMLPGGIEKGDPSGVWTFRFDATQHDTGAKRLFAGTAYEMAVPAGRIGADGLRDALDVIDAMVAHPSTAEFICIKLLQRFVSDGITLSSHRDGTAPPELEELLGRALAAWRSTSPQGNIAVVLRAMLDPAGRTGFFWSEAAYRAKVKSPLEYINSSLRVLGAAATCRDLAAENDAMGMYFFTRDEPDGWPELGGAWVDTGTMLARIAFAQKLAENQDADRTWDTLEVLDGHGLDTAEEIVDFFDGVMFQGTLGDAARTLLVAYLTTDDVGQHLPLVRANPDFQARVEAGVGLMLSMPEWQFQ